MNHIALVVGNGLSMSLRSQFAALLDVWDTRSPLDWPLQTPGVPGRAFLESLPNLSAQVERTRSAEPGIKDFDVFERILRGLDTTMMGSASSSYDDLILQSEMRHFLAIAYSYFQVQASTIDIDGWPWVKWVATHEKQIAFSVSFNYDLILERVFNAIDATFHRTGVQSESGGVPILKPHGSVDMEIMGVSMPAAYPLSGAVVLNDFPIRILQAHELLEPRLQPNIVLPTEYSPYKSFQWVAPGYRRFALDARAFTHCVLLGLSYWAADRSEIDFLVGNLGKHTQVIVANPSPPKGLLEMINRSGRTAIVWLNGPEPILA